MKRPAPRSHLEALLRKYGAFCQGCGRTFDSTNLEVDHIRPKSDGGTDAYENLTLLCRSCNRRKRDTMTITGLQQHNRRNGILLPHNEANIKIGRAGRTNIPTEKGYTRYEVLLRLHERAKARAARASSSSRPSASTFLQRATPPTSVDETPTRKVRFTTPLTDDERRVLAGGDPQPEVGCGITIICLTISLIPLLFGVCLIFHVMG